MRGIPLKVRTVDGITISRELFHFLADQANDGTLFQLVRGGASPVLKHVTCGRCQAAGKTDS